MAFEPRNNFFHLTLPSLFTFGVKVTQNFAKYLLHHGTYAPAKFELAVSNGLGGYAFARKYIILPWGQVTQNVAQNPLHHVIFAPGKSEIAVSNCLGNAFTTKNIN